MSTKRDTTLEDGPILIALKRHEDAMANLNRKVEGLASQVRTIQNSVNLLDTDRSILENIQVSVRALEEQSRLADQRQHTATRDLRADVGDVMEKVETVVDQVEEKIVETISNKKPLLIKYSVFGKILKIVKLA